MTANKRIFLNMIATYGRSVLAIVCGLLSGRWVYTALGQTDYGLFGLVGGLAGFMSFFTGILSNSISRFYAVSIGQGVDEVRKWFNIAVLLHTVVPISILCIGYPVGAWAIRNFLEIPLERIDSCVWVWRFVCIMCLGNMMSVPYYAMYIAKQEIAELTIYDVAKTLLGFGFSYLMVSNSRDWLSTYAAWICLLSIVPQSIYVFRARVRFPECRIELHYMTARSRIRELGRYAYYRFWGAGASMLQAQGLPIIVNKFLGVLYNATMTVGHTVAMHTVSLSTAMSSAMAPAIYSAYGSSDMTRARTLAYQSSKLGAILYLVVVLPAAVEIDELMHLWLKTPPPMAGLICLFVMGAYLTERISDGQVNMIYASGQIKRFQSLVSVACLLGLVLAFVFVSNGLGIWGVGVSILSFKSLIMGLRVYYAKKIAGLPVNSWIREIILPLTLVSLVCVLGGGIVKACYPPSFIRVVFNSLFMVLLFVICVWSFVLKAEERHFVMSRMRRRR